MDTMARILVLEDDPDLLHLYTRALTFRGYQVDTANAAETAIGMIDEGTTSPDIAVLDMHMPGLPGSAVVEYLRGNSPYPDIPIIVISCDDDFRKLLQDYEVMFMSKPINLADLYQAVELLAS
ncbi:MAG: response regulator [Anaerolineae bacterium]|nr:response regulator [Anaerolineae bacterium]